MQKFLTTSNKEIYYQPLQIILIDTELLPEDTLKEFRTLITIAAKNMILISFSASSPMLTWIAFWK